MEIIQFIQSYSNSYLDLFFTIITNLGGQTLGVILAIVFYLCVNKKLGFKFLYAMLFSFSLNNILKCIFNFSRPIGIDGITSKEVHTATGSSFPSGHSQGNSTAFTFLILEFKKKWIFFVGILMMILVPLSRLYLGVHWPRDVIFGTLFGIISVFISNKIFDLSYEKPSKLFFITIFIFLGLGLFLKSSDLSKALGSFLGLNLSIIIERKYINFNPKGNFKEHILKLFILIVGAVMLLLFFNLFNKSILLLFIKYLTISLYGFSLCPYIFTRFNLCKKL